MVDAGNRPDIERRGFAARFYPLPDQNNPESPIIVEAVPEHLLVAIFEDPERHRGGPGRGPLPVEKVAICVTFVRV